MTTRTANAPRVRVLRGERSPVQRVHAPALEEKRNRIRVAAYCRVSTDHEDQERLAILVMDSLKESAR